MEIIVNLVDIRPVSALRVSPTALRSAFGWSDTCGISGYPIEI
jgi:hypothetical protein